MTSRYPLLDDRRSVANTELDRMVVEEHGVIEAHIDESDSYCSMPIRLTPNAAGLQLEIGPYDLDPQDVARLRAALTAYDHHEQCLTQAATQPAGRHLRAVGPPQGG
jgi:hypothetical protein